jgi:PAS domain S-box-containing protein
MVVVVGGVTGGALFFAHRAARSADQTRLQQEYQGEMGWQVGSQEARRQAISERCHTLAQRSVRMLAALEEGDAEDLYRNAEIELRDVVDENIITEPEDGGRRLLTARKFRFLDAGGKLIPPPRRQDTAASDASWQRQLHLRGLPEEQETGYVTDTGKNGQEFVDEVIVTPMISYPTGKPSGALVLFFPPIQTRARRGTDMSSAILLNGRVLAATPFEKKEITSALPEAAGGSGIGRMVFALGVPCMAFSNTLNTGFAFPAAIQVCLYPLTASMEEQQRQQWKIAGAGSVVMLAGLIGSLMLSSRLSRPVQRLVEDSAANAVYRKRAEAALNLTERRYQSIFENAIEGIFVLTTEGRFISVNPALASLCGFSSPRAMLEAVPGPATSLYVRQDRFLGFLEKTRIAGAVAHFELEMVRTDGQRIWVSHSVRCVHEEGNEDLRFEGSMEYITENKRAADELRTLNAGLKKAMDELKTTQHHVIQQERLRALGEMASGVAHDFNNALTPILGYSELILNRGSSLPPEEAAEYLKSINTAATDAANVVNRLREFYRSSAEQDVFHPLDLNALVLQTVTLTQPRWKDQARSRGVTINVSTELQAGLERVEGDASALREMLTNLIFNAVDAMPAGGTIKLRTHAVDDRVTLTVTDAGAGMTEEVRRRCLEPFFSTKGDRGTGLGLSMCFGIIQRHQGTLEVQSSPGKGASFIMSFPASRSGSVTPPAQDSGTRTENRTLRLLVVDDEKPVRTLLCAMLNSDRHLVTSAEDGSEALRLFDPDSFDLVITDKSMPGMNGDQLATAIKQHSPRTPVILLTGFGQFLDPSEVPDIDVIASKPISIESLRAAITAATATCAAP